MAKKEAFVFNTPEGMKVGEASNLTTMRKAVKKLPVESIRYHAKRGDFSKWLDYIGQKKYAKRVQKVRGSENNIRKVLKKALSSRG